MTVRRVVNRLATKPDKPNSIPLDALRLSFSKVLGSRNLFSIHSVCLTSQPPTGLSDAFDWLALALDLAKITKKSLTPSDPAPSIAVNVPSLPPPPPPTTTTVTATTTTANANSAAAPPFNPRDPSVLARKLEEWLHRTEGDMPAEEFVARFEAYDLPMWDHYTHIRLAFLLLVGLGRQKGQSVSLVTRGM